MNPNKLNITRIRQTPLKADKRGNFTRNLGYLNHNGKSQFKFNLGKTMSAAAYRLEQIQSIYIVNCQVSNSNVWRPDFLNLAKQVAATGACVEVVSQDLPTNFGSYDFSYIQRMRDLGVVVHTQGAVATATVELPDRIDENGQSLTVKLDEAVDAFLTNRIDSYIGEHQGEKKIEGQIGNIKANLPDCYLGELGFSEIKSQVDYWRNRPTLKKGKPIGKDYAEDLIGELYKMLYWLESTYAEFSLPSLAAINRKVKRLATDAKKNSIVDKAFSPAEARKLFHAAEQPLTKLMIALAVNTCSGPAELGRMRVSDFKFNSEHPYATVIGFKKKANWFSAIRMKTDAVSGMLLWPWVAKLVKKQQKVCKKNGWEFLFTGDDGKPLYKCDLIYRELGLDEPKTTKPESAFVSRFRKPKDKIKSSKSIGKLRKTFSDYLRKEQDGEIASLALSHLTDADNLLANYTNKPYARLFKATLKFQEVWDLTK